MRYKKAKMLWEVWRDTDVEISPGWGNSKCFHKEQCTEMATEGWIGCYRLNDQKRGRRMLQTEDGEQGLEAAQLGLWSRNAEECCCWVAKSHRTLCNPVGCHTPGLLVFSYLSVCSDSSLLSRWCHPTVSSSATPSSFAFNPSWHQGIFQWVGFLHQVAKVLELQLQHQSFPWIFRVDFF